jgi:hypothetical protein
MTVMPSKTSKNLKGEPEKTFVIRNAHSLAIKVNRILLYHSHNYKMVEMTSKATDIEIGICAFAVVEHPLLTYFEYPGKTFDFIINHDFVTLTGEWHSILLFLEDDLKLEYIEHFYVKVSQSIVNVSS